MMTISPEEDALQFAIYREVEAHYFYKALAERVSTHSMQKIFEELAQEELEHKAKLELEVMKTGKTVKTELPPKVADRQYILSDTEAPLDMDFKDMLLLGIAKEEASFRTYVDLAAHARDEQSRELLLSLAEEELKHKIRFEKEYEMLLKKE
jgi:rubrerythrin